MGAHNFGRKSVRKLFSIMVVYYGGLAADERRNYSRLRDGSQFSGYDFDAAAHFAHDFLR